jgi:hypothetical protein
MAVRVSIADPGRLATPIDIREITGPSQEPLDPGSTSSEAPAHRCRRSKAPFVSNSPAIDDRAVADREGVPASVVPRSAVRELEAAVSKQEFLGIPLGATLNDYFVTAFVDGTVDLRRRRNWLRRLLYHRHRTFPKIYRGTGTTVPPGHVLVTWSTHSHRYDRLLLPVLERLDAGERDCAVLHAQDGVAQVVPAGIPHLSYREVMVFDPRAWRREYQRCWPSWKRTISDACARYAFPDGAFELLALALMVASQRVFGCLEFLEAHRPSVILTEYDRNARWSCLVLAARNLGIPSLTLVHGVIERDAFGFSPVLADRILCWGELDRAKLINAGEAPSRVIVAGCPRLSRDLPSPSLEVRRRLGLDHDGPVAMLATSPESIRFELAETFCRAIEQLPGISGIVRLHPSENLSSYQTMIARHPTVSFVENGRASMDEALAATDIVVVRASGFGSDALVKRKPVVVISPDQNPTGHDLELIELAGCPHAKDPDELAAVLGRMAHDPAFRAEREIAAEAFVTQLCAAFGNESADITAAAVRAVADRRESLGPSLFDYPGPPSPPVGD